MDDHLRDEWAKEFYRNEELASIATEGPPDLMTTGEAVESGSRVQAKLADEKAEPYKFVSVWCELLSDFD